MRTKAKKSKIPWPTKEAMIQVYEDKLWGGHEVDFYSGEGSYDPLIVEPYLNALYRFFKNQHPMEICDLGCGDFNLGQKLLPFATRYIAIDIVPELIERNKRKFSAMPADFYCLNAAKDELPKAEVLIIRQVLQHLSNKEITLILPKLKEYKYVFLTEHLPNGDFVPNLDIISGQGTRLKHGSGVDITAEPFLFSCECSELICETRLGGKNGRICTWVLYI